MNDDSRAIGVALGVLAYGAWGVIPIYWKQLGGVGAAEILAHRVLGSLLLGVLLLVATRRTGPTVALIRDAASRRAMVAATALIAVNWGLFIWAVVSSHLAEASLGYFINPLVNATLGRFVLGERLERAQKMAIGLAVLGVAWLVVTGGGVPWLALALATSFGLYGLIRKQAAAGPLEGFTVEVALVAPIAAAFLLSRNPRFGSIVTADARTRMFLLGAGLVTAVPLLAFAGAARRLRYTTLGMMQFLAPSLQLFCAVVLYNEPFTRRLAVAFALIGCGALLYAGDLLRRERRGGSNRVDPA